MGSYLLGELEERILDGVVLDGPVGRGRTPRQYIDHVEQAHWLAVCALFFDVGLDGDTIHGIILILELATDEHFSFTNSLIAAYTNSLTTAYYTDSTSSVAA